MPINTDDPGVKTVLDNMETIVASEGGSLDLISFSENQLTVKYNQGTNEECPECVPDHDMVKMMIENSLNIYAPHISLTDLV